MPELEPLEEREITEGSGRIRFDGAITAGHIVTAVAMLVTLIVWGVRLEGRIDQEAALRTQLQSQILQESERNRDSQIGLRESIDRLDGKITSLLLQLQRKP